MWYFVDLVVGDITERSFYGKVLVFELYLIFCITVIAFFYCCNVFSCVFFIYLLFNGAAYKNNGLLWDKVLILQIMASKGFRLVSKLPNEVMWGFLGKNLVYNSYLFSI